MSKGLATDANILLAGLFGKRVPTILEKYFETAHLCAPASCLEELQRNAAVVGRGKSLSSIQIQVAVDNLSRRVELVEMRVLAPFEQAARLRIERRDPTDWPVIALAMATGFPIWTQD